jgi:NAD(P)-dependent dehydrogenase (short-subunit alcohol dehydrogenase family)
MIDRRMFLSLAGASIATTSLVSCSGTEKRPADGVPRSPFDEHSTAAEVTAEIDLSGKLAVVTGCTSGIGFETMRVLAMRGAWVVGTSRALQRAEAACARVRGTTTALQLELSDYESVIACANAIRSINLPLDILICNAGYWAAGGQRKLVNGVEKHLAINHLGHTVLVNRLLGRLYMSQQGRIVMVSSRAAYRRAPQRGIEFDNLDGSVDYKDRQAYGQSKLANALFSLHLAKLLRGTRITTNALHPGVINTDLFRDEGRLFRAAILAATSLGYGKTVEEGAATSCYVATSPLLASTSGEFFEDCNAVVITGEGHLHDEVMAAELWRVSEDLTREHLVSHTGPDLNEFELAIKRRQEDKE